MPKVRINGLGVANFQSDMTPEEVKAALQKKFASVREIGQKIWGGMSPLDKAALATAPVPVIGDIAGLMADADMYINDPESRTLLNAGLSAAGLIPFVPALTVAKRTAKAADEALDMSQAARMQRAADQNFKGGFYRGGKPPSDDGVLSGDFFSRDPELSKSFDNSDETDFREFMLKIDNPLGMGTVVGPPELAKLADSAKTRGLDETAGFFQELANDGMGLEGAMVQHLVEKEVGVTGMKGMLSDAGFDFLDTGRDVMRLTRGGVRDKAAKFDPSKIADPSVFAGLAGAAVGGRILLDKEDQSSTPGSPGI